MFWRHIASCGRPTSYGRLSNRCPWARSSECIAHDVCNDPRPRGNRSLRVNYPSPISACPTTSSPRSQRAASANPSTSRPQPFPTPSPAATCAAAPRPARARPSPSASRCSPASTGRRSAGPPRSSSRRRASSPPRSVVSSSRSPVRSRARRRASVYGGVGYEPQRRQLNRGVDVLVACPGRLADLVQPRRARPRRGRSRRHRRSRPHGRHGLPARSPPLARHDTRSRARRCCSRRRSTVPSACSRASTRRTPARHEVGGARARRRAARTTCSGASKARSARRSAPNLVPAAGPTIVFCRTRRGADRLTKQLEKHGVRADAIHGGRSQNQRDRALAAFTNGRVDALVATDVAARGIHVDGVACVVHFDTPEDEKAYLHRSGRTARAGATGSGRVVRVERRSAHRRADAAQARHPRCADRAQRARSRRRRHRARTAARPRQEHSGREREARSRCPATERGRP